MVLLIVQCIMFETYCSSVFLNAKYILRGKHRTQERILAEILIGTSSCRYSLDVDCRAEDHVLASQSCFDGHTFAVLSCKLITPCCSKGRTGREERCGISVQMDRVPAVRLHFLSDTEWTVSILDVSDSLGRDSFRREHMLAVKHRYLFFQSHC